MSRILVLQPFGIRNRFQSFPIDFDRVYTLILESAQRVSSDIKIFRLDDIPASAQSNEEVLEHALTISDIVVCDVTTGNPIVMYQLGIAHAMRKPTIILAARGEIVHFDLQAVRVLIYSFTKLDFGDELTELIREALDNPNNFIKNASPKHPANRVFVSYSHKDGAYLERLLVHLKPLEKLGLIDTWVDTKLEAGDRWKEEIDRALKYSKVAILLITADFLASEFIVENELPPLLKDAQSGGTQIIPVILKPCRFLRDCNLSTFQSVNDPDNPLICMNEAEQEALYNNVANIVEEASSVV